VATSIFPIPSSSSASASAYTVAAPLTDYKTTNSFASGIYTVTCISSTVASVSFLSSTGALLLSTKTVSGTITAQLASPASFAYIRTSTGTDVVVTITLTASALAGAALSGTLDTITTT
jgi:hypothetical protein